jgi:hypothetical protein
MDLNDVFGDCGAAATDHNNMAKLQSYSAYGQLGMPKYEGTLGTYGAYGLAMGFLPLVPSPVGLIPDQGVDNASWLGFLYKQGIIKGYGEVPLDSLDSFAQTGRGVILGLSLDAQEAVGDFNTTPRTPWNSMAQTDGHDTLLIQTHADGSGALITWGGVQPFTLFFRETNITDAWIIFDADDPNVDWNALESALAEVHGILPEAPVSPVSPPVPKSGGIPMLVVPTVVVAKPASNTFKAIVRSLMPFIESGAAALIARLGYHVTLTTTIAILGIAGGVLTLLLHAAESQWPWVGVFLGYIGAPVYAPSTKVSQSTQIAQLEALVAALITQLNAQSPPPV